MAGTYDSGVSLGASFPSNEDIKRIVEQKARELFMVCDVEQKGFVSKRDMQRLVKELPLMPDQLEEVFDSLDNDKNGFLTLEEFTEGFGGFLGLNHDQAGSPDHEAAEKAEYTVGSDKDQDALDHEFSSTMESLGAEGFIAQHVSVRELWKKLQEDEPGLLSEFEDFIHHVSTDIRTAHLTSGELENALKSRDNTHKEDIKNLYEEMERQIRMEKERVISEEKEKERKVKDQLERDIRAKDEQLNALLNKQSELEQRLYQLSLSESEIREENELLSEQNEDLVDKLTSSERDLDESKSYLKEIQDKIRREKRERAQNNVKVAQGIVQERESLFAQLEMLKNMNQQLQDDNDVRLHRSLSDPSEDMGRQSKLVKQGSIMSNYFEEGATGDGGRKHRAHTSNSSHSGSPHHSNYSSHSNSRNRSPININTQTTQNGLPNGSMHQFDWDDDEECEVDDAFLESTGLLSPIESLPTEDGGCEEEEEEEEGGVGAPQGGNSAQNRRNAFNRKVEGGADNNKGMGRSGSQGSGAGPEGQRAEPVGANNNQGPVDLALSEAKKLVAANRAPERLFKVVFVGDSGVGKTSIIHRFCTDTWNDSFSATIGVDFQVKSLNVYGNMVAMQLWDTAGQERFRSITRHYFRKADGIVVIYDVGLESSFLNVRSWMDTIEETTDDHVVKMLLGNKNDRTDSKTVREEVGHRVAETYKCDFYEVSAKTGYNVEEAFTAMSKLLLVKEDEEIQNSLNLAIGDEKKRCCDS